MNELFFVSLQLDLEMKKEEILMMENDFFSLE